MSNATPPPQPPTIQPLAIWNPTRGLWQKPQLDLFGQQEQFWETWPTSGWMQHGSAYPLPPSAHPTHDFESSSSPTALFRTPLASDASRGGETLQHVKARRGTIALSHQIIDLALHGPNGYPRREEPEALWTLIGQLFDAWGRYAQAITLWTRIAGRPAPDPALLNEATGPRPSPAFVEWLMGLPDGWVTATQHGLTTNQQLTALGNGVLPRQAIAAVSAGHAALSQESRRPEHREPLTRGFERG